MSQQPRIDRDSVIKGERFALVVTTHHEGPTVARTAIHRQNFERRIGGVRFVPRPVDAGEDYGLTEVGGLSSTMTEKCLAAMIPADGQKSVLVTTPEIVGDHERKVQILTEHIRAVAAIDPGVIFGPDMEVPEEIQNDLSYVDGLLDHVTGLSVEHGGLSIDHRGYTAEGVVGGIVGCVPDSLLQQMWASVQGFGAVGAHVARRLHGLGVRVRAVSNALGMLAAGEGESLDADALFRAWEDGGDEGVRSYAKSHGGSVKWSDNPDDLFAVRTDIFVPAARTRALALPDQLQHVRDTENKTVQDVTTFFARTGVRVLAEGANGPLTDEAERWLEERGVLVLPDFILNAGGLIGCWVEWEERHAGRRPAGEQLESMHVRALKQVHRTVRENVEGLMRARPTFRELASKVVDENREKIRLANLAISASGQ
jgi:glutamate dehydrogenase (NAD(P)+)